MNTFNTGILFGFCNGISPGPSLVLLATRSIKYGWKAGFVVALSPLIFGIVIIPIFLLFYKAICANEYLVGLISIGGSFYLLKLAVSIYKQNHVLIGGTKRYLNGYSSLVEALLINFTSSHAYFFWLIIGSSIITSAFYHHKLMGCFYFIFGYYFSIVAIKVFIAILLSKTTSLILERYICLVSKFISFTFIFFSVIILLKGVNLIFCVG